VLEFGLERYRRTVIVGREFTKRPAFEDARVGQANEAVVLATAKTFESSEQRRRLLRGSIDLVKVRDALERGLLF